MHFVAVVPAVLRRKTPPRAFATHWALLHPATLSCDEMVTFSNTMLDVGRVAPPSLTATRALPLSAAGWRLCTLSPLNAHALVRHEKRRQDGRLPGAAATVTKAEFAISAFKSLIPDIAVVSAHEQDFVARRDRACFWAGLDDPWLIRRPDSENTGRLSEGDRRSRAAIEPRLGGCSTDWPETHCLQRPASFHAPDQSTKHA